MKPIISPASSRSSKLATRLAGDIIGFMCLLTRVDTVRCRHLLRTGIRADSKDSDDEETRDFVTARGIFDLPKLSLEIAQFFG